MTPDLAELRALADAATSGPWAVHHRCSGCTEMDDESCGLGLELDPGPEEPQLRGMYARSADARFIAAARSAVPAVCDEVDRLRGLLDQCETALDDLTDHGHETFVVLRPSGRPPSDTLCRTCGYVWPCRYARARAVLAELRAAKGDRE